MILQLRAEVAGLRAENAALKDEIWRLKGLPPRPTLKPSGMEQSSKRSSPSATGPKLRGSSRAIVTEERRLCYEPPPGSRFVGRTSFVVQDLTIGVRVVPLSSGPLAFAGWPDRRRSAAGRGRRALRFGASASGAVALSPGAIDRGADRRVAARLRRVDLQAPGRADPDQQDRRLRRRSEAGSDGRARFGRLGQRRRHRGPPWRDQWRVYANRQ